MYFSNIFFGKAGLVSIIIYLKVLPNPGLNLTHFRETGPRARSHGRLGEDDKNISTF